MPGRHNDTVALVTGGASGRLTFLRAVALVAVFAGLAGLPPAPRGKKPPYGQKTHAASRS